MSGRRQDQEEEGKKYRAGVNRKITKGWHAVSKAVQDNLNIPSFPYKIEEKDQNRSKKQKQMLLFQLMFIIRGNLPAVHIASETQNLPAREQEERS